MRVLAMPNSMRKIQAAGQASVPAGKNSSTSMIARPTRDWRMRRWTMKLDRHPQHRTQAAERRIAEGEVAAVSAQDVARDGEAEAGAAGLLVARAVEPEERLEHVLAAVF